MEEQATHTYHGHKVRIVKDSKIEGMVIVEAIDDVPIDAMKQYDRWPVRETLLKKIEETND